MSLQSKSNTSLVNDILLLFTNNSVLEMCRCILAAPGCHTISPTGKQSHWGAHHLSGFMATFRSSCAKLPHCRPPSPSGAAALGSTLAALGLLADVIIAAKAFLGGWALGSEAVALFMSLS